MPFLEFQGTKPWFHRFAHGWLPTIYKLYRATECRGEKQYGRWIVVLMKCTSEGLLRDVYSYIRFSFLP